MSQPFQDDQRQRWISLARLMSGHVHVRRSRARNRKNPPLALIVLEGLGHWMATFNAELAG